MSWNKSYSSDLTEYTFVFLINLTAMVGDYTERGQVLAMTNRQSELKIGGANSLLPSV
ncbi:MAG: hypothetical protein LBS08_05565 [Candidatus Symbiothrix sp.]|nr:hypothetical protein [Candidatus Symbiothrix sp.]